ncbi:chaperone protein dnaJ 72 [Asparagus officinalis]|uniref:chaperone protein dnaJ 72 n=1 Tax=Asparagus officinalis TaxID=4686 RepID=UPI00098E76C2|nr:chaperone protein dnaJ 72 [Asparagus officinalis]
MDHYKTLGLNSGATKHEIKEAFRKCALKFHPDRHSNSTKEIKDGASIRFKQASEAYEVLIDDRKRRDYDFSRRSSFNGGGRGFGYGNGGSGGSYYRRGARRDGEGLLNVAFASLLFGGAVIIERSVETLWRVNNSGKSPNASKRWANFYIFFLMPGYRNLPARLLCNVFIFMAGLSYVEYYLRLLILRLRAGLFLYRNHLKKP